MGLPPATTPPMLTLTVLAIAPTVAVTAFGAPGTVDPGGAETTIV